MAARSVYRAVEEAIDTKSYSSGNYYHSSISRSLRYSLREYRDFATIYSVKSICQAGIAGNSQYSMQHGVDAVNAQLENMVNTLPYINANKTKSQNRYSSVEEEREAAVERYLKMLEMMKKEEDKEET